MARKSRFSTSTTPTPAPARIDPDKVNAAVEMALSALGDTAGAAQVEEWITRYKADVRFDKPSLDNALKVARQNIDSRKPADEDKADDKDEDNGDRQDGADDNGDNEDTGHDKDSDGSDMSTADLVRSALEALGTDAGINSVEPWIKENYPGHKYNRGTLGSTISTIRKKIEGGDTGGGRRTSNKTPAPFVPSTTDMSTLQTLVRDSKLSLTEFENTVRQVQGWADQCGAGSIGNLLKTAEALRAFLTSMQNIRL